MGQLGVIAVIYCNCKLYIILNHGKLEAYVQSCDVLLLYWILGRRDSLPLHYTKLYSFILFNHSHSPLRDAFLSYSLFLVIAIFIGVFRFYDLHFLLLISFYSKLVE